ncbi:hypothetical protein EDB84DRAFT_1597648 [Lactarius hengduanensis]|nr:hypothetical protein EDB84DRAFT_1597648 [Lactarius hengduanensis]
MRLTGNCLPGSSKTRDNQAIPTPVPGETIPFNALPANGPPVWRIPLPSQSAIRFSIHREMNFGAIESDLQDRGLFRKVIKLLHDSQGVQATLAPESENAGPATVFLLWRAACYLYSSRDQYDKRSVTQLPHGKQGASTSEPEDAVPGRCLSVVEDRATLCFTHQEIVAMRVQLLHDSQGAHGTSASEFKNCWSGYCLSAVESGVLLCILLVARSPQRLERKTAPVW